MPTTARERLRLEVIALAIHLAIAVTYCVGAALGLGAGGWLRVVAISWIGAGNSIYAYYAVFHRMRGHRHPRVEWLVLAANASYVSFGWIAVGDPSSPAWGIYLYAAVAYTRRYRGRSYLAAGGGTIAALLATLVVVRLRAGEAPVDANVVFVMIASAGTATLSYMTAESWQRAERRARLLAETDPLTGIANRRTFFGEIEALARAPGEAFSVLMLDLDNFKRLNDEQGHAAGDQVLMSAAQSLTGNLRPGDRLARYGGEEFVAVLPHTPLSTAAAIAERLRAGIEAALPTTVSIGCATREPHESADSVIRRADAQLLIAKRTGKNLVRVDEALRKSA
jgi:diguanylate cyclase (GGDEF)-like protein